MEGRLGDSGGAGGGRPIYPVLPPDIEVVEAMKAKIQQKDHS